MRIICKLSIFVLLVYCCKKWNLKLCIRMQIISIIFQIMWITCIILHSCILRVLNLKLFCIISPILCEYWVKLINKTIILYDTFSTGLRWIYVSPESGSLPSNWEQTCNVQWCLIALKQQESSMLLLFCRALSSTDKPLSCPQKWTSCIVTPQESRHLEGGLGNKKARAYY